MNEGREKDGLGLFGRHFGHVRVVLGNFSGLAKAVRPPAAKRMTHWFTGIGS